MKVRNWRWGLPAFRRSLMLCPHLRTAFNGRPAGGFDNRLSVPGNARNRSNPVNVVGWTCWKSGTTGGSARFDVFEDRHHGGVDSQFRTAGREYRVKVTMSDDEVVTSDPYPLNVEIRRAGTL